jgi:hypothetical protein
MITIKRKSRIKPRPLNHIEPRKNLLKPCRAEQDYYAKLYLSRPPAGGFENFSDGHGCQKWRFKTGRKRTPTEHLKMGKTP